LSALKRPSQTGIFNNATVTNLFCFFNLGNGRAGVSDWEEQLWIFVAASGLMTPIHKNTTYP
jgi:hypothetical protein